MKTINNIILNSCFLCWEKVELKDKITCYNCNIHLHYKCYEYNSAINNINFLTTNLKCPHCKKIIKNTKMK